MVTPVRTGVAPAPTVPLLTHRRHDDSRRAPVGGCPLRDSLGVVWGIPSRPDVLPELVEPALAQYVPDYPRVIGHTGPRTRERWIVRDLACPPPFDPDAS